MMNKQEIVFPELPYYFNVYRKLDEKTGIVKVEVHSRVHVNKVVEMPTSWSIDFVRDCNARFLGDILGFIVKRYGLRLQPTKYE